MKVFIIKERRKMIGSESKTDREGKVQAMINDGCDQEHQYGSNDGCHGNISFLYTDCRTEVERKEDIY